MDSETVSRMLARVVHRGPDDEGRIEVAGNVLGHRRLSIVDAYYRLFAETLGEVSPKQTIGRFATT
jgi:hypothetical protein